MDNSRQSSDFVDGYLAGRHVGKIAGSTEGFRLWANAYERGCVHGASGGFALGLLIASVIAWLW